MYVVPVRNVLIPNNRGRHTGGPVRPFQMLHEHLLELLRESVDETVGVIAEHLHLALMAIGQAVTFEAVFVTALLLAHLAVPFELL